MCSRDFDAGALVPPGWFDDHPGIIPTKAVVVIEGIDEDGRSGYYHITSDSCPDWAEIGLLRAALISAEEDWRDAVREVDG